MGGRVGGITSKYYYETRGIKVSGGQKVKSGTILTRQGNQWKPGLNVIGRNSLTAGCDGEVYFTRRKNGYNKVITLVNIRPS
jgi:ribosomal protein L27